MIIHNLKQGTDEWFEVRRLKLTASKATAIGNCGKGLETLVKDLIIEAISPQARYTNLDIDRGNELEPIARTLYYFEYGVEVAQVGFVEHTPYCGCSPDGFIGDHGLMEIKCPNDKKHFELITGGNVDSDYIWQMQMQMLITGRKWCDFVSYNPNFKQALFVKRFYPADDKQERLLKGIDEGTKMLKELLDSEIVKTELGIAA